MAGLVFGDPHPLGLPSHEYSHPVQILGSGTFGKVYLCCRRTPRHSGQPLNGNPADPYQDQDSLQLSEWVAVKIYKPVIQCELRYLEYLKREAVNQRRLNHEHVIGFKQVGLTTDLRLYLTLEYADSGSLKQWLEVRGGSLPESTARWFCQQLVYGLAYCHAHGVFNRDIKPANLLLHSNRDGPHRLDQPLLKVADFGLCKSSKDSAPKSRVGSPHYMAPEVFTGEPYDGRKADVFSCGVVLYQMVFGALPFNRTLDGRPLDFNRNFREIQDNVRREIWPQLLPTHPHQHQCDQRHTHPQQQPSASGTAATAVGANGSGGAAAAAAAALPAVPSASLLNLLHGVLRYDPDQRLTLLEVMHHPWYREGLTDEAYAQVLSVGSGVDQRPPPPSSQSVELIEAEFCRIMQHCAARQQEAAPQAIDEEFHCYS
ncbi:hypothetical protein PLESTB_001009700 [Pleodorina starrii]|uniref:Protein kinase domain-containing protein n=1 Tax=Pleodorina starrii TaxID=330485 RepID=A0A9W6BP01_9CHLO|nr:hypothetical protein PLESTM_001197800 [Pleodorina starrii]GLC55639.1 hypothetical protein PLESTB_001009700 [Pleodorina starrii]GLC65389.1 hypothetical protein PLESTF_000288200 [Pleodorina starrii]